MKLKKLVLGLVALTIIASQTACFAKVSDSTIRTMVGKYKVGNFLGCIQDTDKIINEDPSNIYAYYYKGLSFYRLGKIEEATSAFTKVTALNSNATLVDYASRALGCIETPEDCKEISEGNKTSLDKFIQSKKFYDAPVQAEVNKKKLDRIRENINDDLRNKKSEMPTNEEIANAVKTLAKLGFNPMASMNTSGYQNPEMMQMSMLLGNNPQQNNGMNMLPFLMMNQGNVQNMSPELIQSMMMNQMTPTY